MNTRFELALKRLDHTTWARFEKLCSAFLAGEYPSLRTLASPSGDQARDAVLFTPEGDPSTAIQYSVTDKWPAKIRETAKNIKQRFSDVQILIYMSNQEIGAKADNLHIEIRKVGIYLDVRDRNWFIERTNLDAQHEDVAEELAKEIVDPYLASQGVITGKAQALSAVELQAAFIYLSMQLEDDTKEKGLTKVSFDALVRSVLRDTDPENRMSREEVLERVRQILPAHRAEQVDQLTNSALNRLTKKHIRHYQNTDDFCLVHEERLRVADRLASREKEDLALQADILDRVTCAAASLPKEHQGREKALAVRARRVMERFLFSRGELFAAAVRTGRYQQLGLEDIRSLVIRDVGEHLDKPRLKGDVVSLTTGVVVDLLTEPGTTVQSYLRSISDSYTLLAFLQQTPDVQGAVTKMFSYGEIWLDSSILLPLFAERLADESQRRFTQTVMVASDAGLSLRMTKGVVEELVSHMRVCLACSRTAHTTWEGRVPFLYSMYVASGRSKTAFAQWLEEFRGDARPLDDIADYLHEFHGVQIGSLADEAAGAEDELRITVLEIWRAAHERRRAQGAREFDEITVAKLVAHDVENYLGVIVKRGKEQQSPFGYGTWWLTLDHTAFQVQKSLETRLSEAPPSSPVMSPDFLTNYLAFGPMRMRVSRQSETALPVMLDSMLFDTLPPEIIDVAEKAREEAKGLPEHVVRRRVRDAVESAKRRRGDLATSGAAGMEASVKAAVQNRPS